MPLLGLVGCAGSEVGKWVASEGGIDSDAAREIRVKRVLPLVAASCQGRNLSITVLANDNPAAFSFRNGRLFVTRGLVDLLSEQELVAALDHEVGHLLSDGQVRPIAGLKGCEEKGCVDGESAADLVGRKLLQRQGESPAVMVQMLQKVRTASKLPAACGASLDRRIELLKSITDVAAN